jgi:hypothetical protein
VDSRRRPISRMAGTAVLHSGGDHPADVQCGINNTLGKCKKNSGCKYLHLKVRCRFEQPGRLANVAAVTSFYGGSKVCRYFQTSACNREPCRFEHKLLDRGVCWAAYEQHCRYGTNCRFRYLDTGASPQLEVLLWNAEGLGNSPSNPKVADIVRNYKMEWNGVVSCLPIVLGR